MAETPFLGHLQQWHYQCSPLAAVIASAGTGGSSAGGSCHGSPAPARKRKAKAKVPSDDECSAKRGRASDGEQSSDAAAAAAPEPAKDYIHVRARRGQATDSHSLAERVRREKISERMKLLQEIVPGCNKVSGKAVMLDEIISYVQSLQRQVEFLSMKLATVNPQLDFAAAAVDSFVLKDIEQSCGAVAAPVYSMEAASSAMSFAPPACSFIPLDSGGHRALSAVPQAPPPLDAFDAMDCQAGALWHDELQSVVQMAFSSPSFRSN